MINDRIEPRGEVEIEIFRSNGHIEKTKGSNTISAEVKNVIAKSLQAAITGGFGCLTSPFDNDDLSTPPNGESGIYLIDNSNAATHYQMVSTLNSSTLLSFIIKGVVRAAQAYTFSSAVLGHDYQTNNFTYEFSTFAFSSAPVLANGDQLTVTWTITMADS